MKQSEEFDDILNECLERILRGETVEQCLACFPQHADKLRPLLEMGSQVKKAAFIQPRPEFRSGARLQFQAALNAPENKTSRSFLDWLRQPQWAAVTAFALLLGLSAVTAAMANGSMPDQPLYPVKLAMEKIQISITPSASARGELYARILERRLDEIARMAEENKPDKIGLVAGHLDSFVAEIAASAPAMTERSAAPQITAVAPESQKAAAPAAPPAPDAAPPPQAGAADVMMAGPNVTPAAEGNVTAAAAAGDTLALPAVPVLDRAAAAIAGLRALLETATELERPALRDAVAAAERTYEALVNYLARQATQ